MKIKNILFILLGVAILLLIPLVAMQFTAEVSWTGSDFLIMGVLLFVAGLLLDFAILKASTRGRKIGFAVVIVLGFLYIWAELAVGVFTHLGS